MNFLYDNLYGKKMTEFGQQDVLQLTIEKATSLVACDINGASDPYVKVRLNNSFERKTQIRTRTLNPVWNEIINFYAIYTGKTELNLKFEVYDWDRFTKDVSFQTTVQ